MSGIEIERKFLLKEGYDFKARAFAHHRIQQGYILSANGRTVRVRLRGTQAFLTIKGPSLDGGLSRYEFEKEITPDEARQLFRLCEPGLVDKTRYLVRSGSHVFEVDEFHGDNQGLLLAEVELSSPDEPFLKPDFIGKEVTGDRRYYNAHLRQNPFKLWGNTAAAEDPHNPPA